MSAPRIGPYEVVRELGRGGMGVVLEVRHPELPGRRLALKLISKDAAEGTALERFSREARLLARVKHPNVVGVHTFATADDGRPYLVTDLVEGTNLKQVARAAPPVDPARAAAILRTLAGAVSALHAAGILHRDLKPENVILQADDSPVLLDFGLAREHDAQRLTQTGTVLGTPAYMSPEQAGGDSPDTIDARCDVYGLGAILFERLAGRPPFDGTAIQIVTAVLRKDPRWPSEDRGDVPADLEAVLRKAMAKEAAARYGSAAELGKDLARFAGGERVAAPRTANGSGRGVALAAAVVVVVGGLGLAVGLKLARREVVEAPVAPVVSSGRPTRPTTPPASTTPPPLWNPATPIASYRAQSNWLADSRNDGVRDRGRTLDSLRIRRSSALRRIDLPEGGERGHVFVRFLSDTRLAVMLNEEHVRVLDLDRDERVPRWTLLGEGRAFDLEVTGSTVVFSGVRGVYRARLDEPAPDSPKELAPFVTFDVSEALPDAIQGAVDTVAISPDGHTGVAAGQFSRAILFDLRTDPPTELRRFGDFKVRIKECAFSRDGERIVIGSDQVGPSATFELWTKDGQRLVERGGVIGAVKSVAFSPDGSHYVIGTNHVRSYRVDGLDTVATRPLVGLEDTPLLAFAPAPQRRLYGVMGADASKVMVWRTDSEPLSEHRQVPREGSGPMDSIAVSPDGAILAIGGRVNGVAAIELYGVGD